MSDFSFMKSGSSLVNDPTQLSEEEIAAIASPVVLYTKKALEICEIYVSHCGRIFVQPEDVLRCLQYTAFEFNHIINSEEGKKELCDSYKAILNHLDEEELPFEIDESNMFNEITSSKSSLFTSRVLKYIGADHKWPVCILLLLLKN